MRISPLRSPICALILGGAFFFGGALSKLSALESGPSFSEAAPASFNLSTFSIVIVPGTALASNTVALDAFNRAAQRWASLISDPITITINANLAALGANVLGSTSLSQVAFSYDSVRTHLIDDAANESNDGVLAHLPALFTADVKSGYSLSGNVLLSSANAKALGYTVGGTSDGAITFSTGFNFDYDNRDGVDAGKYDFETVAVHEIGHVLGFLSSVDAIDPAGGSGTVSPSTLDLFRFANKAVGKDPATLADFESFPRNLVPGTDALTDDIDNEWRMSTGVASGDGRQASHWKSDEISGTFIGVMDPTVAAGVIELPTYADFRAFDLIGYDIDASALNPVPEPGTAAAGLLVAGYCLRDQFGRRSRAASRAA